MYKNVKMFACLSELVKEVDGKRVAVQDLYVLDGKLMAQLAFRGVEVNGNYEQVKDAYRRSRLYFRY